jgi:hypothetical protein
LKIEVGREFHIMCLCNPFGRIILEHGHFQIEKVNKKTFKAKHIIEIGCGWMGNFLTEGFLEKFDGVRRSHFESITDATPFLRTVALHFVDAWTEDLKGYTIQHPKYIGFLYNIEVMKQYADLLSDYSNDKHKILMKEIHAGYDKLEKKGGK